MTDTHARAKPQWIKDAREPYMFNMDSVIEQIRAKKVSTWFGTRISGTGWRPSYKKKNLGMRFQSAQYLSHVINIQPGMGIGVRVPAGFLGGSAYSYGANLASFSAFHM